LARKRVASVQALLLAKSREAALSAVQGYNNPLTIFKAESFIVMMIISWTYLLHAYYLREKIEYRYVKSRGKRRQFLRIRGGSFKYWDLAQCLKESSCPLDSATRNNLLFLLEIRHEIEHHHPPGIEAYLGSKFQACCLNYEFWLTTLFGEQKSVAPKLSLALQFLDISLERDEYAISSAIPASITNFIQDFESSMSEEDFSSPRYEYRIIFTRKLVNHRGQADRVIEFVDPNSEIGEELNRQYWAMKAVEKSKHLPKSIVDRMRSKGFTRFSIHHHTVLWKEHRAKDRGKGYGIKIEGKWYWYDTWLQIVEQHCEENRELYTSTIS
jgi:hypothetical protein